MEAEGLSNVLVSWRMGAVDSNAALDRELILLEGKDAVGLFGHAYLLTYLPTYLPTHLPTHLPTYQLDLT